MPRIQHSLEHPPQKGQLGLQMKAIISIEPLVTTMLLFLPGTEVGALCTLHYLHCPHHPHHQRLITSPITLVWSRWRWTWESHLTLIIPSGRQINTTTASLEEKLSWARLVGRNVLRHELLFLTLYYLAGHSGRGKRRGLGLLGRSPRLVKWLLCLHKTICIYFL